MGDHRCLIKLEFDIHNKVYKTEMNINYFPNNGIDERIVDWFDNCWDDALRRYHEFIDEHFKEQREADEKKQELAELARLKVKYEGTR